LLGPLHTPWDKISPASDAPRCEQATSVGIGARNIKEWE
jgi:hypothetical protein